MFAAYCAVRTQDRVAGRLQRSPAISTRSAAHFLKSYQLLVQKFAAGRDRQKGASPPHCLYDPRPSVRVTRGAGGGQHLASVLQERRENANIDAGLGFIWRISDWGTAAVSTLFANSHASPITRALS